MDKVKRSLEWFVLIGSAILVFQGLYALAAGGFGALAFNHVVLKG